MSKDEVRWLLKELKADMQSLKRLAVLVTLTTTTTTTGRLSIKEETADAGYLMLSNSVLGN